MVVVVPGPPLVVTKISAKTDSGGPGTTTTTLTYLVYIQSLVKYDVGGGSAGGIIAVILANIVAIFVMRMIGKNLDA